MSQAVATRTPSRFHDWLPATVDRRIRVFAWLSFLAEVLIIATGGAVRLTGSGLGCPTWPTCTPESLVNTPEMGIHGVIEFGNRTLTGLVGILALIVVVLLWRMRRERRDLFMLALVVVGGVVAQAIVGGITVLTGLNPFIVGFHYVASLLLVCVCAAFLVRMHTVPGPRRRAVPLWYARTAYATLVPLAVTISFGVLTTGAGPHSGDVEAGRNGFNAEVLEHVHAWPGYVLLAALLVLAGAAWARTLPTRRWATTLLGVVLVQIAVGIYQARNGLPELAVGVHMVLAALSAAAMTVLLLNLTRPAHPRS
ncbi:COX15/CtaA family protein [Microbacterium sp. zg.Y1090]|uniref:COX15/CtaA family protein n=1 Tax=Microbacterium TaxID=33882 RepID=UPI00214B7DE7|nr:MULTISPECIES: COX15/CtaA family protein [unclassified Microbacterium]MCR2812014.1 COX15/CtaA family protein [Microbacterium sp. zg.Y1084]MCR2818547.1 COX15/CtaA family protein [Microbacterium sp. zg.Y1090]MDL5486360.1 COX15/CtaA family protein [Microbacterium sp. zg-Y1211]WIM29552.1 COX15/CtaA family protein [Microbacterium sp. zg-Y1090]